MHTALVCAVVIATLLPWGLRTQQQFGTFQLISMNGGSNLWMGNHEGSDGGYVKVPDAIAQLPLPAREQLLRDRALSFVIEHPRKYAALCATRILSTLRSDTIFARWNETGIRARFGTGAVKYVKALCTLGYFAALGLLACSLFLRRRSFSAADAVLITALAVLALPFVLIVGGNRYHVPLAPYVLVWAAAATQVRRYVTAAQPAPAHSPMSFGARARDALRQRRGRRERGAGTRSAERGGGDPLREPTARSCRARSPPRRQSGAELLPRRGGATLCWRAPA